jgi:hypothetical protein
MAEVSISMPQDGLCIVERSALDTVRKVSHCLLSSRLPFESKPTDLSTPAPKTRPGEGMDGFEDDAPEKDVKLGVEKDSV